MSEEAVYRRLAERLDSIPNGFSATESGVELKLLAKIFKAEEAALAAVMRLTREPAADIAARAGVSAEVASRLLKTMVRKGQIRAGKGASGLTFGLMPFVVGIYEEQLHRMDAEMAELFEQYFQETSGGTTLGAPPVHRVIPVQEAVPVVLDIFTYEQANRFVEGAKSWGVRDCICRVQQQLVGKGCDHEVRNCLSFAPVEGAFRNSRSTHPITREEALRILRQTEEAGLVHTTGNYRDGVSYICNCCTCCCGILRGLAEFGVPTAVARSGFRAAVDTDLCIGCGECIERCPFGALAVPDGLCVVDHARCVGCGVCAAVCSTKALHLERRPEGEFSPPPADPKAWAFERAERRGLSLSGIL